MDHCHQRCDNVSSSGEAVPVANLVVHVRDVVKRSISGAAGDIDWNICVDGTINRAHQHATNTSRPGQDTGVTSNYKNPNDGEPEPAGHGIARSRDALTTKIHHGVDGRDRPLAIVITVGQRHDGAMLPQVLADIRVPRIGPGLSAGRPSLWIESQSRVSAGTWDHGGQPGEEGGSLVPVKNTGAIDHSPYRTYLSDTNMIGHLVPLVPHQGSLQLFGQIPHLLDHRARDLTSTVLTRQMNSIVNPIALGTRVRSPMPTRPCRE